MTDEIVPAPAGEPRAKIFISYSRKDIAFVDRLEAALQSRGFVPTIDRTEILAFEDWWKRIEGLIGQADTVVFVLSPDAVASEIARKEVAYAASLNKRFAPIVCRRADDQTVPEPLQLLNFIFFDDPAGFEASADALTEALQTDIGWIRRHTEFGEAARRWTATGRPDALLLRPPVLEEAEYVMAHRPDRAPPPTLEAQNFVAVSRKAETLSRTRRRRIQVLIYALLAGTIVGLIGWINQAYIAEQITYYRTVRPFAAANIWPYVLSDAAERALKPQSTFKECAAPAGGVTSQIAPDDYCPEMVVVPAGSFIMGSPPNEKGRWDDEGPQHRVTIARPFAVAKFELTFSEWDTCVAYGNCSPRIRDAGFGRKQQPTINVNWSDAQQYVAWLSKMTGKPYRLLTEAEYEYATRAGTQTVYPWGNQVGRNNANCGVCGSRWDGKQTAPVGSFAPNRFGLYDTVGNVEEWVEDCANDSYSGAPSDGSAWLTGDCSHRVLRASPWGGDAAVLRSAFRSPYPASARGDAIGFRVARTLLTP
jgi:formylglycine-generating enzyme required for sulfatase activity